MTGSSSAKAGEGEELSPRAPLPGLKEAGPRPMKDPRLGLTDEFGGSRTACATFGI